MERKKQGWKRISSKTVWNKRIHLVEHSVLLPGGEKTSYIVEHGVGAVATLLLPKKNSVLLTYQYRFPIDEWIYDLPGGGMRPKETPKVAAIRECEEETGYKPKKLIHLATYFPNPGKSDWPMHIFFCSVFKKTKPLIDDPSEMIRHVILSIKNLEKLILKKKIIDPSLLIGWFTARNLKLI